MWFKKSKSQRTSFAAILIGKIVSPILKAEEAATSWVNFKTQQWNRPQQLVFLLCICMLLGGGSLLLLFNGDRATQEPPASFYPALHYRDVDAVDSYTFTSQDSAVIAAFVRIADSMQHTPEGQTMLQQFFTERPGFLDSLDLMRSFYPSIPNFKKKLYEP